MRKQRIQLTLLMVLYALPGMLAQETEVIYLSLLHEITHKVSV